MLCNNAITSFFANEINTILLDFKIMIMCTMNLKCEE